VQLKHLALSQPLSIRARACDAFAQSLRSDLGFRYTQPKKKVPVSRDLFEKLMADEEHHIDFLETQLHAVDRVVCLDPPHVYADL
jgi:bacterioferritin (cytochrome b1)